MSIYGALFSGVSGINAQSDALSAIADNITNVNTIGYKRVDTQFSTLVTDSITPTQYSPGGVSTAPRLLINSQGLLQASSSSTDLAVEGSGLFVVNTSATPTATSGTTMFTRAGSFTPDANGNLRNAAGLYLQGWPIDQNGNIPVNRSDVTALKTVNINGLTGNATPTTLVSVKANLQASTAPGINGPTPLPTAASLGVTSTASLAAATGLADGDTFTVATGSGATATSSTFTFRTTPTLSGEFNSLSDLAAQINATTGSTGLSAAISGTSNAVLTMSESNSGRQVTISGTLSNGAGTPLFATTSSAATYTPGDMATGTLTPQFQRSFGIFDSHGTSRTLNLAFSKDPSQGANVWRAEVFVTPASDVDTASYPNGVVASGNVAFNTDGTLNGAGTTLPGNLTIGWNPASGVANSTIALNIGSNGSTDGITQYDGASQLIASDVNGTIFGSFTGVRIDDNGVVTGVFDNGTTRNLYKLPLATFPNVNGLANVTGNAYTQTSGAGSLLLQEANQSGAGKITPSALESSTVDLATEFTNMITTQRAYSAAGKIITTADQMLDELISLKR